MTRWLQALCVALMLASSSAAWAKASTEGLLRGVVTHQTTGLPVASVVLTLRSDVLDDGAVTLRSAVDGSFTFDRLPDGVYSLEASLDADAVLRIDNLRIMAGRVLNQHVALPYGRSGASLLGL